MPITIKSLSMLDHIYQVPVSSKVLTSVKDIACNSCVNNRVRLGLPVAW
jgi:hypothetical protein